MKVQTGIPVELVARPRLAVQQSGGDSCEALPVHSRGASLVSALRAGVWTVTRRARWIHGADGESTRRDWPGRP